VGVSGIFPLLELYISRRRVLRQKFLRNFAASGGRGKGGGVGGFRGGRGLYWF